MTLGDTLVGLGFVACFGLLLFFVRRALQVDRHLRAQHNGAWNEIHRTGLRGVLYALRFFLFFGWRRFGPDPKLRLYLRDMLVAHVIILALIVVVVAVGASLPLKVFRYVPAKDGVGGNVVFDSDGR